MTKSQKKLKIAFIGAQCSAKTTTLLNVMATLKLEGYNDVAMVEELARKCPYPINQGGTIKTQTWMILHQILAEQQLCDKYGLVLSDRSAVDPFIYASYLSNRGHIDQAAIDFLGDTLDAWVKLAPYDTIFLFTPLPIVGDADRPADAEYQAEIDRMFQLYFRMNKDFHVILVNQGSKTERIEFVTQAIKGMLQ